MKAKFVVFDCDGVLVDSEIIANRLEAEVKTQLGFPTTTEEQIRKFVGMGVNSEAVQDEIRRLPSHYLETVDAKIHEAFKTELLAIAGVRDTLAKIPNPKCVASSSHPFWLRHKLEVTQIDHFFRDAVFSGHEVKHGKPAPDLFLYAAQKMGWDPKDCVVIEDSVAGVLAGKEAGMNVCGFLGGSHILDGHSEQLLEAGADHLLSEFAEIRRFLS